MTTGQEKQSHTLDGRPVRMAGAPPEQVFGTSEVVREDGELVILVHPVTLALDLSTSSPIDGTTPNAGEGWYEFKHPTRGTSHIAYVLEGGGVYLPDSTLVWSKYPQDHPGFAPQPFITLEDFQLAATTDHFHKLIRADRT